MIRLEPIKQSYIPSSSYGFDYKKKSLVDWDEYITKNKQIPRTSTPIFSQGIKYFSFIKPIEEDFSIFFMIPNIRSMMNPTLKQLTKVSILSGHLNAIDNIALLKRLFIFKNPIEIERFLVAREYVIDFNIFFEIYRKITKIFNSNILNIFLEYYQDSEEDYEKLFIIVRTNLYPNQSLTLLDKFDEEYWLDVDDRVRKILEVDIESI